MQSVNTDYICVDVNTLVTTYSKTFQILNRNDVRTYGKTYGRCQNLCHEREMTTL